MEQIVNHKSYIAHRFGSRTKGDKIIWTSVILLALVSLLAVYSSTGLLAYKMYKGNTEIYLFKQFAFIIVGVLIIYFAHQVNYIIYSKVAKILFLISIPLLIYTLFYGVKLNEGSRWIRLPIINLTFQTSDLAKLALFMYLSRLLSKKQEVIKDFKKGFLPVIIPVAIVCILIAPANLSTALLIGATSMMLMLIGRIFHNRRVYPDLDDLVASTVHANSRLSIEHGTRRGQLHGNGGYCNQDRGEGE